LAPACAVTSSMQRDLFSQRICDQADTVGTASNRTRQIEAPSLCRSYALPLAGVEKHTGWPSLLRPVAVRALLEIQNSKHLHPIRSFRHFHFKRRNATSHSSVHQYTACNGAAILANPATNRRNCGLCASSMALAIQWRISLFRLCLDPSCGNDKDDKRHFPPKEATLRWLQLQFCISISLEYNFSTMKQLPPIWATKLIA